MNARDGGYEMLDDFALRRSAYNIGICGDVSWDPDLIEYGFGIYMYDHTIGVPPTYHEKFHFFCMELSGSYHDDQPKLKTLGKMLAKNGQQNEKHMILRSDIEGAEYDVLTQIEPDALHHFKLHNLARMDMEETVH